MVREELDWKNQPPNWMGWLVAALAFVLLVLYGAIWLRLGEQEPLAVVAFLAAWTVVYLTRYWQPILYPVAILVLSGGVVLGLLIGAPDVRFFWGLVGVTVALVALMLFLFKREGAAN